MTQSAARHALDLVLQEAGGRKPPPPPGADARRALGDTLVANAVPLSERALAAVDAVYELEAVAARGNLDDGLQLESAGGEARVVVWRGDITTLEVDAVVNAANDQALGCFQPSHRCIDNVLHRAAGPRLREECRAAVAGRPGARLPAGDRPLLTGGYHLPARHVLHVTGPALRRGDRPTAAEEATLASCYRGCLDVAAAAGLESVAFCCVSTGLFGYPARDAARVALRTARDWLAAAAPGGSTVRLVVFDVFLASDEAIYRELAPADFRPAAAAGAVPRAGPAGASPAGQALRRAAAALREADAVLVCAGAGMSVTPGDGRSVYTSAADFSRAYGRLEVLGRRGYNTASHCMGLFGDAALPAAVKWGFWASHMRNMRWRWEPSAAYAAARRLIGDRDHFAYTSNVDGGFVRSGFDESRVYTPQGDWQWYQCSEPCRPDAYWPSRDLVDGLVAGLQPDGAVPSDAVPRCRHCGALAFPGVHAGRWFLHEPHDEAARRFAEWLDGVTGRGARLVILEIGAGYSTPAVTRFPMERIARRYEKALLVRVNPTDADVPPGMPRAVGLEMGWGEALRGLEEA